jgi:hypothetical protein
MKSLTGVNHLRRPAIAAIALLAIAASTAVVAVGTVGASNTPKAMPVGHGQAVNAPRELDLVNGGAAKTATTNPTTAPKTNCDTRTTTVTAAPITVDPHATTPPAKPLNEVDYGSPQPPSLVRIAECGTDTTPGSSKSSPGAGAGDDPVVPDPIFVPDPNVPNAGSPEPVVLTPPDDSGNGKTPATDPNDCTTVTVTGSGPDVSPAPGTPEPLIADGSGTCSTDTTPGSSDSSGASSGSDGSNAGPITDGPITDPSTPDLLPATGL